MLAFFRRKRTNLPPENQPPTMVQKGLLIPESPATLLATLRRQKLLEQIWQRTSVSRAQFALLYRTPLERYAALVQQFPASEAHHHAYAGGMLDHGLEITAYALKLRQSHLLPVGAPPETQAAQAEAWTAATAYAALLHDIGKIAVDLHVEYANGARWFPWHGPLAQPYRFRYRDDRLYRLHGAANGLLYVSILERPILDWLSGFSELWAALLYLLAGQYEHAGILGELVVRSDQASVAQELGGNPEKAQQAPKHSLQRKLMDGLRYLVREELKLNQPKASDGWLTDDALWLVSKTVCDKLRAHLLSQGFEGIPSTNVVLFNVLQDHGVVQATGEGKAIWKATVTAEHGWTQSFTFLRVAPTLIWKADEFPAPFSGTVRVDEIVSTNAGEIQSAPETIQSNPAPVQPVSSSTEKPAVHIAEEDSDSVDRVLELLNTAGSTALNQNTAHDAASSTKPPESHRQTAAPTNAASIPDPTHNDSPGAQLLSWLREGVRTHRIIVNDAKALVHTVAGTAYLVSPGVFQRFVQERPHVAGEARASKFSDWEWIQKHFEKLRVHKKGESGLNIWTCDVTGPRKTRRLHGYLLIDGQTVFAEVPPDNPYLKLQTKEAQPSSDAA